MFDRNVASLLASILVLASSPLAGQRLRPILFTDWGRLCSIGPADTTRACLPKSREFDDLSWSPDGRLIVTDAWILNDAGRHIRSLPGWNDIRPVWSPDGKAVFAIDYDIGSAVHRWNQPGGKKQTIPVQGGNAKGRRFQMLAFSPSGRRAALLTMDFSEMVIASVEKDRFVVSRTAPVDFAYVSQSVWLNEDTLLFVGKRGVNPSGGLWRLAASTGAVDSIGIPGLSLRDQIVISPDRKRVVVTATDTRAEETRWNLWVYDLSSRVARRLTSGKEDIVHSWR